MISQSSVNFLSVQWLRSLLLSCGLSLLRKRPHIWASICPLELFEHYYVLQYYSERIAWPYLFYAIISDFCFPPLIWIRRNYSPRESSFQPTSTAMMWYVFGRVRESWIDEAQLPLNSVLSPCSCCCPSLSALIPLKQNIDLLVSCRWTYISRQIRWNRSC